jgi:hypothetical protein
VFCYDSHIFAHRPGLAHRPARPIVPTPLLAALDACDVTPGEARDVLELLKVRAEMVEQASIEHRLAALERAEAA